MKVHWRAVRTLPRDRARSYGCLSCAWFCVGGDLCYCPEVVEIGREAQLDLFAQPEPFWLTGRCPRTGLRFRRLRGKLRACEHWRWIKGSTLERPWTCLN